MKPSSILLSLVVWLMAQHASGNALRVFVLSSGSEAGASVRAQIDLDSSSSLSALQFDVSYDPAVFLPERATSGSSISVHNLDFEELPSNRIRTVLFSNINSQLPTGRVTLVSGTLRRDLQPGDGDSITVENIIVTDSSGGTISLGLAPLILSPLDGQVANIGQTVNLRSELRTPKSAGVSVNFTANGEILPATPGDPLSASLPEVSFGAFALKATAEYSDGAVADSEIVTVLVLSAQYSAWMSQHWNRSDQSDPNLAGPTADPDADGRNNLLERAEGTDPNAREFPDYPALTPVEDAGESYLAITFLVSSEASDLGYIAEVSSGLKDWKSGPGETIEVSRAQTDDGMTLVTVRDAHPLTTNSRYMRVRISP